LGPFQFRPTQPPIGFWVVGAGPTLDAVAAVALSITQQAIVWITVFVKMYRYITVLDNAVSCLGLRFGEKFQEIYSSLSGNFRTVYKYYTCTL